MWWIIRTFYNKHFDTRSPCRLHLFRKASTKSTLLGDDGLGVKVTNQVRSVVSLIIYQALFWKTVRHSDNMRCSAVQNSEPTLLMFLPERSQPSYGAYARQSQQPFYVVLLQLQQSLVVVFAPDEILIVCRIDPVVSDDGCLYMLSEEEQVAMQVLCKGVGSVDDQSNIVFTTASDHLWHLHSSRQVDAVHQFYLLPVTTGRIIIRSAGLLQHLHGLPPLRRSSKYQHHSMQRYGKCLKLPNVFIFFLCPRTRSLTE